MPGRETALELYRIMLKIRMTELKIAEIYPTDKIQSPVHLSIGQEAVSAGVCLAMEKTDHLYGTYRGHGVFIAKGGDIKKLMAELYGKDTGCSRGKGGSMHLVAPEVGLLGCSAIVASTIPVATGDAMASALCGRKRVSVTLFGDGAIEEGVFFESLNFAALKNLPVIYVCENNNYAVHSPLKDRHKITDLYKYGENLGVPGRRYDGFDAGVVYASMKQAVDDIRAGGGPVLLEYTTYRLYEHVGIGQDHLERYRDKGKLEYAKGHDSLEILEKRLQSEFAISRETFQKMEKAIAAEIEDAVQFAEESPFPDVKRLYEDLYKERE